MIKIENTDVFGWEAVKGYNGNYLISKQGDVYSVRNNKLIKPFVSAAYKQVELNLNGKATKHLIHRLVAQAYIPNPNNFPCVNHKDGNKLNNDVSNLEWCNYSNNMRHASNTGLLHTKGSNNPASKLTEEDVKYIRSVYKKGDKEFGLCSLGRKFGVDHKTIWCVVNEVTWRDVI